MEAKFEEPKVERNVILKITESEAKDLKSFLGLGRLSKKTIIDVVQIGTFSAEDCDKINNLTFRLYFELNKII